MITRGQIKEITENLVDLHRKIVKARNQAVKVLGNLDGGMHGTLYELNDVRDVRDKLERTDELVSLLEARWTRRLRRKEEKKNARSND